MLEGVAQTIYSESANVRPRLLTPGGAVDIAGAVETAISTIDLNRFGYLSLLEATCLVAGTTAGSWTLRLGIAGTTALLLPQPIATSVVGTRYCWAFPVPWKTDAVGGQFTIQASAATLGTWRWLCNGFRSRT